MPRDRHCDRPEMREEPFVVPAQQLPFVRPPHLRPLPDTGVAGDPEDRQALHGKVPDLLPEPVLPVRDVPVMAQRHPPVPAGRTLQADQRRRTVVREEQEQSFGKQVPVLRRQKPCRENHDRPKVDPPRRQAVPDEVLGHLAQRRFMTEKGDDAVGPARWRPGGTLPRKDSRTSGRRCRRRDRILAVPPAEAAAAILPPPELSLSSA